MSSEFRMILLVVAALAAAALLTRSWVAHAAVIQGDTLLTAPVEPQHAQLQHAQVRSLAGSGLRVAAGF